MMDKKLEETLKSLRLGGWVKNWDSYIELGRNKNLSSEKLVRYMVEQEAQLKQDVARTRRIRMARIKEVFTIDTYPFKRQPNLSRKKIMSIYDSFDYVQKSRNIIFIGPTGIGKSSLATSFLLQALNRGYRGLEINFKDLLDILYQAQADHSEQKVLKTFSEYPILHIDEIGYVETESAQVGLFFTLMRKRCQRTCSLITSNLGFDEWATFLKNEQLVAALLDRLLAGSYVLNMKKCKSLSEKPII